MIFRKSLKRFFEIFIPVKSGEKGIKNEKWQIKGTGCNRY
jgi:hypothetical protein